MSDQEKYQSIVVELTRAYWMELETVINYLANSVNLDGVRAEEIKKSLAADVTEEMNRTQRCWQIESKQLMAIFREAKNSRPVKTRFSRPPTARTW